MQQPTRVLFLCTANSARSLMAEAILRQLGGDEVIVASAGTAPTQAEPDALQALQRLGVATTALQSKDWQSLAVSEFDYVITLCDRARHECQLQVQDAHFIAWDFPDPVGQGEAAFLRTAQELSERIRMFLMIVRKRAEQSNSTATIFNQPQDLFKILADPLRLQMVLLIAQQQELCVCDLVTATSMSQPKVSRHLAQLREYGLLTDRRDARWVYYRLNPALPDWMRNVVQATLGYNPQLAATA